MRSQEHIIKGYIELMVQRFEECIKNGNPRVDIVDWYNVSDVYKSYPEDTKADKRSSLHSMSWET